jgi:hypothetical protein
MMRSRIARIILLVLVGGLVSGCVIEPGWGWHHGHHDRY